MKKKCLECIQSIVGRSDKKFCSDICRNNYNNKRNSVDSQYLRSVNTMLKRNRKILEELTPSESSKISKEKLLQKGFNFHYHTNILNDGKDCFFFCYEYGYLPINQDQVMLVKRNEQEC